VRSAFVVAFAAACNAPATPPPCIESPCLAAPISWGSVCGTIVQHHETTLDGCGHYVHVSQVEGRAAPRCERMIPACAGPGWSDVRVALAHPDVSAAFSRPNAVYGFDMRSIDGAVLGVRSGASVFYVGNECAPGACPPIPPGVAALAKTLRDIDRAHGCAP